MFGVVRPCRHRLRGTLYGQWMGHLCGLCLTLRDLHGQSARLVTNYDGLLVSVLAQAQVPAAAPLRTAGPCALRGFRPATVLDSAGQGAQLAAAVSLVLAAGKIGDHIEDGDGAYGKRLVASSAARTAGRWQAAGQRSGAAVGFDVAVLTDAIGRQADLERAGGLALHEVTEPTETAVSAAFAHTAVLAGRPGNAEPLAAAGRNFGRIAHLLDAAEDLPADRASGAYNPLLATRTSVARAREHCSLAADGLAEAVGQLDLADSELAESLLVREVGVAVDRIFADIERRAALEGAAGWPVRPAARRASAGLPCLSGGHGGIQPDGWIDILVGRRSRRCADCCCECDCDGCDCSGCDCGGCDCC